MNCAFFLWGRREWLKTVEGMVDDVDKKILKKDCPDTNISIRTIP